MPEDNCHNFDSLVFRAREGDKEAFDEIMNLTWDSAIAAVTGNFGTNVGGLTAEDLTEAAFVSAWQKLSTLQNTAVYGGWFRQILMRKCIDAVRIARASKLISTTDSEFDRIIMPAGLRAEMEEALGKEGPSRHLVKKELVAESIASLTRVYTTLTSIQKKVFMARVINLFDENETAKSTGLPIGTVRSATIAIQKRLQHEFMSSKYNDAHFQERIVAFIEAIAGWRIDLSRKPI